MLFSRKIPTSEDTCYSVARYLPPFVLLDRHRHRHRNQPRAFNRDVLVDSVGIGTGFEMVAGLRKVDKKKRQNTGSWSEPEQNEQDGPEGHGEQPVRDDGGFETLPVEYDSEGSVVVVSL
jgi:hypothetical protein